MSAAITIQATLTGYEVSIRDDTFKAIVKYMDGLHLKFARAALKVHRKTVFEILINLLRYTPVLTGRLRGSWTPFLDTHGKQSSYMRYLNDSSLVRSKPATIAGRAVAAVKRTLGIDEVSKGKAEGFFTDSGLVTTVGSNVAYAASVNAQSHYLDLATIDAERIINANFEHFLEASRKAGWIPTDYPDEPRPEN